MNEPSNRPPQALLDAIKKDLAPVKPLAPPWRRALFVVPVALVVMGMPFLYYRLRDTTDLGATLGWMPVAVQILLAFALLVFALREGIPGWRASAGAIFSLCVVAYTVQIAVNLLIFLRSPASAGGSGLAMWMQCFRVESLIGLPMLIVVAWLVARTLPQRPWLAGFLAGTGAGFAGDASWRMFCPYSDPTHILLGHTGGILVLGLTGFLLGYLWSLVSQRVDATSL